MKKILFSVLALCLITGCGAKEENPVDNSGTTGNDNNISIEELSLDNVEVEKIVTKFHIDNSVEYHENVNVYEKELLDEDRLRELAYVNSKDLIKKEGNCNTLEGTVYDGDGYGYTCNYISYSDFNSKYNALTGKVLPKEDISFGLRQLLYDKTNDIYRICDIYAGGGSDFTVLSKLDKAYKSGEYIFIYEKAAYVSHDYESADGNYNKYLLFRPSIFSYENGQPVGVSIGEYTYDESNPYAHYNKMIDDHINKFDTYKWTFKLDSNGEYVYDSISYVSDK